MITKILIAYDGSESAKEAMDFAFELAHHFNSELYVMAVFHLTEFGGEVEMQDFVSRTQSYFYQRMRNLRKQYPEMKKKPDYILPQGIRQNRFCIMPMVMVSIILWSVTEEKNSFLSGCWVQLLDRWWTMPLAR